MAMPMSRAFHKIHNATGWMPPSFNIWAALLGPIWAAARGVWGMFWGFLILEMIAWVQLGRGLWGNPGAQFLDRAETQAARAAEFLERAEAAKVAGEDPARFEKLAANLTKAAEDSFAQGQAASSEAMGILVTGLALLVIVKLVQGFFGNSVYERQYSRWRITPGSVESGRKTTNLVLGLFLVAAIAPLTVYKFTVASPSELLNVFPEKEVSPGVSGRGQCHAFLHHRQLA